MRVKIKCEAGGNLQQLELSYQTEHSHISSVFFFLEDICKKIFLTSIGNPAAPETRFQWPTSTTSSAKINFPF